MKKNIVKERNKSKQWYSEWYVKPATPGKSKECVTKHKKGTTSLFKPNFHRQHGRARLSPLAFS